MSIKREITNWTTTSDFRNNLLLPPLAKVPFNTTAGWKAERKKAG